jgi:energy-coupling factor transporter transmembrane protein EcfT
MSKFNFWFFVIVYIAVAAFMVAYAGWQTALFIIGFLSLLVFLFAVLPWVLEGGNPPPNTGNRGYHYSFDYKFGAKHPKL